MITDEIHSWGRKTHKSILTSFKNKKLISITVAWMQGFTLTAVLAVDDVERPVRSAGILQHLGEQHGAGRHALRGLHQVGVAAHHAHGKHPQRDHGREVEGRDASAHADGQTERVDVHVFGDGGQSFTEHQGSDAAGVLHHLWERKENVCKRFLSAKKVESDTGITLNNKHNHYV